jgi:multiple sugar transport system permease protein
MSMLTRTRGATADDLAPRGPRESLLSRSAALVVMGVFTLYFLVPIWWLFIAATKDRGDLLTTNALWFSDWNFFQNVADLFAYGDGIYLRWLVNSAGYAGLGALLATVIAGMCGYALAKYRFKGREAYFNVVLGGVLVPATALALPLFLLFSQVNLTNTFWAVLLPSIVSPFGVYLSRIYASASVPDELIEAGRLDGAGEVRTFFTVSMRLMTPALVTVFLFQFVAIWNNFLLPYVMLADDETFPVTVGLFSLLQQGSSRPALYTLVITGALLSIVPLIALFLGLQRYWRVDLLSGVVKS